MNARSEGRTRFVLAGDRPGVAKDRRTKIASTRGNISKEEPGDVERLQDPGLVEAGRDGDPQGRVLCEQDRTGALWPNLSEDGRLLRVFILAKVIPGREEKFYEHAKTIEKAVAEQPHCLDVLKLHYLRWLLFPIKGETYF